MICRYSNSGGHGIEARSAFFRRNGLFAPQFKALALVLLVKTIPIIIAFVFIVLVSVCVWIMILLVDTRKHQYTLGRTGCGLTLNHTRLAFKNERGTHSNKSPVVTHMRSFRLTQR